MAYSRNSFREYRQLGIIEALIGISNLNSLSQQKGLAKMPQIPQDLPMDLEKLVHLSTFLPTLTCIPL
jgi:hypothetical protein